ncbi:MAG: HAMP domain-containing sensor histidine kinase [Breznakiellaceae bacterium]
MMTHSAELRLLILLFFCTVLITVGGIFFMMFQEQNRLTLMAEYRAFQLAADLNRAVEQGNRVSVEQLPNLLGFGIYTIRGEALYRYGNAPLQVDPRAVQDAPHIRGDEVSLLRAFGGMGRIRNRFMMVPPDPQRREGDVGNLSENQNTSRGPRPPSMMMAPMAAPRLVFLSYRVASLQRGMWTLYILGSLLLLVLVGTYGVLIQLARRIDLYRLEEARNRELITLGEAARSLSHEIKNPLGVLRIQTALLKKMLKGQEVEKQVDIIEEEIDRINTLTERVRQYLGNRQASVEPLDMGNYLLHMKERYGNSIEVSLPLDAWPIVKIDRQHLDQILDNLIRNALESMEGQGESLVTLRLSVVGHKKCLIEVADRGPGIPKDIEGRIYDLFFTTKTKGSGIGLALVKKLLSQYGGTIYHRPREGGGTLFYVELPYGRLVPAKKIEHQKPVLASEK